MGSSEWKFVAGGALAAALFVGFHFMVPGPDAAALKHDHTKRLSYVKVPHRAANVLERRLGEVASLVAGRPVQVRCEDFSDGEIVEPGRRRPVQRIEAGGLGASAAGCLFAPGALHADACGRKSLFGRSAL
jgi:hypothetical protein